ncbi:hypothetical protein A33M_1831 [Rhodovulum sp. PH10]|uniref:hypothetical protein n=1 Tax=Rhodovulum sp. PH10 TaxID=1187851 RepID=UPI00027C276E|nr:hypothetical protein [Rhodovulum sp. PH10]EJW12680.1 hypothetical protein A33M_1831 [Rhodovulum sp. PH10]
MRYWTGLVFFALGAYLFTAAVLHRRKVLAARAAAVAAGEPVHAKLDLGSVATMGEMMRPVILFFVMVVALQIVALYFFFGGDSVMALTDLVGLLFLFAAYATWMSLRVEYRMSELDTARKEEADRRKAAALEEAMAAARAEGAAAEPGLPPPGVVPSAS